MEFLAIVGTLVALGAIGLIAMPLSSGTPQEAGRPRKLGPMVKGRDVIDAPDITLAGVDGDDEASYDPEIDEAPEGDKAEATKPAVPFIARGHVSADPWPTVEWPPPAHYGTER